MRGRPGQSTERIRDLSIEKKHKWKVKRIQVSKMGMNVNHNHCPVALLKGCSKHKDLERGTRIHSDILKRGMLAKDNSVGSSLISMYAKCGALAKAREVFDHLPCRTVVAWNALITGYAQHGHGEKALNCYAQMKREGISPSAVTYVCILKACGVVGAKEKGQEIHGEILKGGLLGSNILVCNALLDMYAKCGDLEKAHEIFSKLRVRDVVSWNIMISGYAQHGYGKAALRCFRKMQRDDVTPNEVTFLCTLKACGHARAAEKGEMIHSRIVRRGLLKQNPMLGTALVDMYAKCGSIEKSQAVFDEIRIRDVIAWTALIGGYVQHGDNKKALDCFESMQQEQVSPNAATFVCVLKACGSMGVSKMGEEIHAEISQAGMLKKNMLLGTTLVDMYARLGNMMKAQAVFDDLQVKDVECWNAIISGYGQLGKGDMVIHLFEEMTQADVLPSPVTFNVVLSACSNSGLLDKAEVFFSIMSSVYGLVPDSEHYTCMVDLFARAGFLDKAVAIINKMPTVDYFPVWSALLGACQKWRNSTLGAVAFENAVRLDGTNAALYAGIRNVYATAA